MNNIGCSFLFCQERFDMTIDEQSKKKMLSYRWAIFGVLAVAYFFVYFHRTTGGAISQTLQDAFGVGSASIALLASAYLYAYTLMQIPSGILTDKLGPRTAASAFVALIAVGSILSALAEPANNFNLMIAGKFIIGIGAAVLLLGDGLQRVGACGGGRAEDLKAFGDSAEDQTRAFAADLHGLELGIYRLRVLKLLPDGGGDGDVFIGVSGHAQRGQQTENQRQRKKLFPYRFHGEIAYPFLKLRSQWTSLY